VKHVTKPVLSITAYTRLVAQMSINLESSFILTRMFRFKCVRQFVEMYEGVVVCVLNMEDLISNNFYKYTK
jgi:hypothetical protein